MRRFPSFTKPTMRSLLLLSAAIMMTACSKQDEFVYVDESAENQSTIFSVIDENGEKSLESGTVVGVYVIGDDGSVTLEEVEVGEDGTSVLPKTSEGSKIIAYAPYQEDWGEEALTGRPVFTVKTDQRNINDYNGSDLMIGSNDAGSRSGENEDKISFQHILSKVAIHVIDETGDLDMGKISGELISVRNSVEVNLQEQTVTTIEKNESNVLMYQEQSTDWRVSLYAIIAPQKIDEGTPFYAVSVYGSKSIYPMPQTSAIDSGKTYTLTLRLTDYGLLPEGWTISDWTEEEEQNMNMEVEE